MANPNQITTRQGQELEPRDKRPVEREGTRAGPTFRPDVDIVEQKDAFVVVADLPGADDRNVEVRLENGLLSIDARLASQPEASWTPLHAEYRLGGYQREFSLSEAIDADAIEARMTDGVLQVRLPKASRHQPRRITVQG
jgi:HSP20 family molecular chaperone IbpA